MKAALEWAGKRKPKVKIYRSGKMKPYLDICNRWKRDPLFQNAAGNAKPLPATGPISLSSLIRAVSEYIEPTSMTKAMLMAGCIKRAKNGNYVMLNSFFQVKRQGVVPFEPYAAFLERAVIASTLALQIEKSDKHSFWLQAIGDNLSERKAAEFCRFVKRTSQSHMMPIDDWLEANAVNSDGGGKPHSKQVVGAGLFTFLQPIGQS
jgi:hypothetical protein